MNGQPIVKFYLTGEGTLTYSGWTAPGWYFWDETEAGCEGPYATEEVATIAADQYFKQLSAQK